MLEDVKKMYLRIQIHSRLYYSSVDDPYPYTIPQIIKSIKIIVVRLNLEGLLGFVRPHDRKRMRLELHPWTKEEVDFSEQLNRDLGITSIGRSKPQSK